MAKVQDIDDDDILWRGNHMTVRAARLPGGDMPAKTWVESLDKKGTGQFLAACTIIETSWVSGRGTANRATLISTSKEGVSELRVTSAGSTAPHLRLLFVREGMTMWALDGFTKQKNKLTSQDIGRGDSAAKSWRSSRSSSDDLAERRRQPQRQSGGARKRKGRSR
jgi:hypothetical protein